MSWTRKFHLEYTLPDGNIWRGMINVSADTEAELYKREDIKGTFWAEKLPEGWRGSFTLECGIPDKRTKDSLVGTNLECLVHSVITNGVYRPDHSKPMLPEGVTMMTSEEVQVVLDYTKAVKYESIPRFEGRLEDCIVDVETHDWDRDKSEKDNKKRAKEKGEDIDGR